MFFSIVPTKFMFGILETVSAEIMLCRVDSLIGSHIESAPTPSQLTFIDLEIKFNYSHFKHVYSRIEYS